jgi:hypothetical protein
MKLTQRRHYKKKPNKPLEGICFDLNIRMNRHGEYILMDLAATPRPTAEKFQTVDELLACLKDNFADLKL